jgi:hypothetical protein
MSWMEYGWDGGWMDWMVPCCASVPCAVLQQEPLHTGFVPPAVRKWRYQMATERAIEILNPEHREHYDSIETVNEACRMGM